VIIADLDQALTAAIAVLIADGALPATSAHTAIPGTAATPGTTATAGITATVATAGTWRPDPDGEPASFATSVAFELAPPSGREPATVAAALAPHLRRLPWVARAASSGEGYLTITVTPQALVASAARQAAAGAAAARSTIRHGTTVTVRPWPDMAAAPSWRRAWQDHAAAMTSRLAEAAGAAISAATTTTGERAASRADAPCAPRLVAAAVSWFGLGSVRYRLARTVIGQVPRLDRQLQPGSPAPDPLYQVRHAQTHAASTLRWAADLCLDTPDPGERAGDLLDTPAERRLLGLLPWLPVRVASAARRRRPDVLPAYLEQVADAWLACWQAAPALPFGGRAAPRDPAERGARLLLADAVQAVLAAGLTLTGVEVRLEGRNEHG